MAGTAPMRTTGGFIRQRVRRLFPVFLAGLGLIAAGNAMLAAHRGEGLVLAAAGALLLVGALVAFDVWVRCLSCHRRLTWLARELAYPRRVRREDVTRYVHRRALLFCPFCGTSFDTPVP